VTNQICENKDLHYDEEYQSLKLFPTLFIAKKKKEERNNFFFNNIKTRWLYCIFPRYSRAWCALMAKQNLVWF